MVAARRGLTAEDISNKISLAKRKRDYLKIEIALAVSRIEHLGNTINRIIYDRDISAQEMRRLNCVK